MDQFLSVKKTIRLQQWQQRIHEFQSSGMKLNDWLLLNNITKDAYYYWLRKCRAATVENLPAEIKSQFPATENSSKPRFTKLEVRSPIESFTPAVIVRLPYATLEVTNDASRQTVEAVLLALKATC